MATFTAASAKIQLVPDLSGFHKKASADLGKMKLSANVDLAPDLDEFARKMQAVKVTVPVKLDVDKAGFQTQLEGLHVTVPVTLDVDKAGFQAQLAGLSVKVPVHLDIDRAAFEAQLAMLPTADVTAHVGFNHAQVMAAVAAMQAQVPNLHTRIEVDHSQLGAASAAARRLGGSLGSIGGAAKIGAITAAVGALVGAVGMAAGAVGGLAVGFAGLGAVATPAIGGLVVGLRGIGDAFSAFGKSAAGGGAAAVDASGQIASAERSVQTALRQSKQAQEDLTRARKDARREIDDMNMSLRQSALDEREAAIAVADARDELAKTKGDPKATVRDREKAQLALDQAVLRQEEAAKRSKRAAADTAEANRRGVEGSDQVVKAKQAIADADYQVTEAQRALADAMKGTAAAAGGSDPVAEALAELAPNAREFVLAVHSMADAWDEVKNSTQDALFAGAADSFKSLATTYMPVLETGLVSVATALNGAGLGMSSLLQQEANVGKIGTAFAGSAVFIDQAKTGLFGMTQGLIDVAAAAAPAAAQLGQGFGAIFGEIGQAFTDLANSGALTNLFNQFGSFLEGGLGPALGDLVTALTNLGNAVLPALTPAFAALGQALVSMSGPLGELGASFAAALVPLLPIVAQFVSVLADGLTPIMPILGQIIGALGQALMPLIPPLSQALQTVGRVIAQLLPIAGPVFTKLAELLASVFAAVAPLLPPLFELASAILTPLIGIVKAVVDALAPFIAQLVDALKPVIEAIAPVLAQVGQIVGEALVQGIQALAPVMGPLIDAFLQLMVSLLPILPPIAELAAKLLPIALVQFQILAPVVTEIIKLFTWLVTNVLMPLLLPILNRVIDFVGLVSGAFTDLGPNVQRAIQVVIDGARSARDWVVDRFNSIVDFVGSLPQRIRDGARGMWDGLTDGFRSVVNTLIGWWNNFAENLSFTVPDIIGVPRRGERIQPIPSINWRLASGGHVTGPGGPTDDKIDAKLSNGEFVMKTAAVRKYGVDFMNSVNAGAFKLPSVAAFASGGAVGKQAPSAPAAPSGDPLSQMVALLSTIAGNTGQTAAAAATGQTAAGGPALPGADGAVASTETAGAAFTGLGTTITTASALISPALTGVQSQLTSLASTAVSQLGAIATPAVTAFGARLASVQSGTIAPALAAANAAVAGTGAAFSSAVNGTINPRWTDAGNTIRAVAAGPMNTAFTETRNALWNTANTFGPAADTIAAQWSQVREGTAAPVRFTITHVFNDGLVGMWNSVSELIGTKTMGTYPVRFATGGAVSGPGGPTDDKIPALLSNREFVAPVKMIEDIGGGSWSRGAGMLESARRRSLGARSTRGLGSEGLFSAYAKGGVAMGTPAWNALKRGHDFARNWDGAPYVWGGSLGPDHGTDCSGYMSSIADVILGGSGLMRKWATMSFPGDQGGAWVPGLGAGFSVGISEPHTAGTLGGVPGLPNVNVESGGAHGRVAYGGPAVGADSSQFPRQYHMAIVDGSFVPGGGASIDPGQMVADAMKPHLGRVNASLSAFKGAGTIGELPGKTWDIMRGAAQKTIDKKIEELLAAGAMGPLGAGSEFYAKEIIAAAKLRALGPVGAAIGVATSIVETGLKMYANNAVPESLKFPHDAVGSDHDSIGLFQQRQAGWGTVAQRMNARASAGMFFDRLMQFDWRSMDPGAAAQRVQVSAFPDRYGQAMPQARGLVAKLGYDQGGWLEPGLTSVYNGFRKPEAILSPAESEAFVGIAQRWVEDERAGSTYVGQQVENQWLVDPDAQSASTRRSVRRALAQEVSLV